MAEALPKAAKGRRTVLLDWLSSMCIWRWPGPREPTGPVQLVQGHQQL